MVHFNFAFCMKIFFEFFLNEKRKKNRFSDKLLHRPMSNIEVDMQVTIFWKKKVSFVAFGIQQVISKCTPCCCRSFQE